MAAQELKSILSDVEIYCEEDLYKIKEILEENNIYIYIYI